MIEKIAFYLGKNDEKPNIDLAISLVSSRNIEGIKEIVNGLKHKQNQAANDCIKVLYEVGEREPKLISDYVCDFIQLLKSKNNRLVWGGMTALAQIAPLKYDEIYNSIYLVKKAYETGSVITVDNSISVFAKVYKANKKYGDLFELILNHLKSCRPKEVAQHAERAFICINNENSKVFVNTLSERVECLTDAQRNRVKKIIKKVESGNYEI